MRVLSSILTACILICSSCVCAQAVTADHMNAAVKTLTTLGFTITEEEAQATREKTQALVDMLKKSIPDAALAASFAEHYESQQQLMYTLLLEKGFGVFDPETYAWTPTSNQLYAFDAEVFDIPNMYALFLQGVASIVPNIRFENVTEDLSGITDEFTSSKNAEWLFTDGMRSVSFTCNGQPYRAELASYGDWFNPDMINFINHVLKEEGFAHQLHIITSEYDQMIMLIYASEDHALSIKTALGTSSNEDAFDF